MVISFSDAMVDGEEVEERRKGEKVPWWVTCSQKY